MNPTLDIHNDVTDDQKALAPGDVVDYLRDDGSVDRRRVRHAPFEAKDGTWVVFLECVSGYVALCRVTRSPPSSKRMHVTVDIRGALAKSARYLAGMLTDNGRSLSGPEARRVLAEHAERGFTVLPVCDSHDARGYCLGHADERPEPRP